MHDVAEIATVTLNLAKKALRQVSWRPAASKIGQKIGQKHGNKIKMRLFAVV
ncbi:MAG: hypothetical protein MUF11_07765 [Beijerinckiaceae bacterium]|nr:hypothetical protein [Beijerinckiaceae bacterium]